MIILLIVIALVVYIIYRRRNADKIQEKKEIMQRNKEIRSGGSYTPVENLEVNFTTNTGLTNSCIKNGYCTVKDRKYYDEAFRICIQNLAPGEIIEYCFVALYDFKDIRNHSGPTVFAVTSYRLMLARLDKGVQKFINTQMKTSPTIVKHRYHGVITLKIGSTFVPIGVPIQKADEVFSLLMQTVFDNTTKIKIKKQ